MKQTGYIVLRQVIAYFVVLLLTVNLFSGSIKRVAAEEQTESDSVYSVTISGVTNQEVYAQNEKMISYQFNGTEQGEVIYQCIVERDGNEVVMDNITNPIEKQGMITIQNPENGNSQTAAQKYIYEVTFQAIMDGTVLVTKTIQFQLGDRKPECGISSDVSVGENGLAITNDSVTVTFTADKDSRYEAHCVVEKTNGGQTTSVTNKITFSQQDGSVYRMKETEVFADEGIYNIEYYLQNVNDSSDKITAEPVSFEIDKSNPEITVATEPLIDNEEGLIPLESEVTYSAGVSELCDVEIHVNRTDMWNRTDENDSVACRLDTNGTNAIASYIAKEDGIYEIYTSAVDLAGNPGDDTSKVRFKIDSSAPLTEIWGVNGIQENNQVFCQEDQTIYFRVNDLSPNPLGYKVYVSKNDSDFVETYVEWNPISGNPYQYESSLSFTEDGKYKVCLEAEDANGIETDDQQVEAKAVSFVLDKTEPLIEIKNVKVTYESAQEGKEPIEIQEQTDDGQNIVYYLDNNAQVGFDVSETNYESAEVYVNANKTKDGISNQDNQTLKMTKANDSLSVIYSDEGYYVVQINGKDAAGNYASGSDSIPAAVEYFVIDKTNPVFVMEGVEEGQAYQDKQKLTLKATDDNHDFATYTVTVERWLKDGTHIAPVSLELDVDAWQSAGDNMVSQDIWFTEEGNYKVIFTGMDKAGRKGNSAQITFRIDTTNPIITMSSVDNGTYHNESVSLDILVDEFNRWDMEAHLFIRRTLDGSVQENEDILLDTANKKSFNFIFDQEGCYDIWLAGKDAAGNIAVDGKGNELQIKHLYFVIDCPKSKPILSISGVDDFYMTREPVTLTFQSKDRNHDFEQYSICVTRSNVDGELESFEIKGQTLTSYDVNDIAWTSSTYQMEEQRVFVTERTLRFTKEGIYEITFTGIDKAGNEAVEKMISFYIDCTAPQITGVQYSDVNGLLREKYNNIYSSKAIKVEFSVKDMVAGVDNQRVYVTIGTVSDRMADTPVFIAHKSAGNRYYVYIPTDLKVDEFNSPITIWANDVLGNERNVVSENVIYNTFVPVIHMECDRDYSVWTNQDITFHTTVTDEKSGLKEVTYKVNDKIVKKVVFNQLITSYDYDVTATESASKATGYAVTVEVINNCGTGNTVQRQVYIDKVKPKVTLSGVENGKHYKTNQTFQTNVQDVSYQNTKTVYVISRKLDGKTDSMSAAVFHSRKYGDTCSRKMLKEGSYKIYAITTDSAGNRAISNTLTFVIDKTAPKLSVSGIGEGSMNGTPVTLDFSCEESFYATNQISIQVEKTLDGKITTELIEGFPRNAKRTTMSHTFSSDGIYRVTISATDRAGNVALPQTINFSLDQTKPEIRITGTDNYEQWDKPATIQFTVEESFYAGNNVTITGTRVDIDGNKTKVELPSLVNSGKISSLSHYFDEDGIYSFEIVSKDQAGNRESSEIHFTIDQTAPQINHVEGYDGGYYQEFQLADSLEEIFKDLTVISYHILLNGVEYNGTDVITEEGKYNLYVEVEDELGHQSQENAEFIIDHTAPKVIFSGVKDGESVHESGIVTMALTNTEDEITGVRMNGVDYGAETRMLAFSEYGAYRIEVDCQDKAGNKVTRTMNFVYSNPVIVVLLLVSMGALIAFTCIWLWVRTRKKEEEEMKI